jgi:hypothetical protein
MRTCRIRRSSISSPALFPLGVADEKDELSFFNASFDMASISMRSFVLA